MLFSRAMFDSTRLASRLLPLVATLWLGCSGGASAGPSRRDARAGDSLPDDHTSNTDTIVLHLKKSVGP
jgi:hypothetical protein